MTSNAETTTKKSSTKRRRKNDPKAREIHCTVSLLDGETLEYDLDRDAKSPALVDRVFDHLNVLEKDYFGVFFIDPDGDRNWLDPRKLLRKQVRDRNFEFFFGVKFYALDPNTLHEDLTRYQVCLQVKKDILTGNLTVSQETASLLASYSIQAELGDHDPAVHDDDYLSGYQFIPDQPADFLAKVKLQHKEHHGQTPAVAENHFLEHAKRLEGFGIVRYEARDQDNVLISLGVSGNGIDVLRDDRRINRFSWPKVMKLAFRRKKFSIKIRPSENDEHETTVSFRFDGSKKAKLMWKIAVMHHVFFRMSVAIPPPKRTGFLKMGSKFRYSGRTLRQLKTMEMSRQPPEFERKPSKRFSKGGESKGEKEKDGGEEGRPTSLSYAPGYVPSPQAKEFVDRQRTSLDAEKATKETEEEEKKEEDVHTKEKEREKENEKEEAEEEEEDGGGDLPPPPPTFLAEQAAEVEEQAKEEQTPGGKDDLDPDYQELEDGSEPTSPQNTVGLEVEIQTALANSPIHKQQAKTENTTANGGTVTARTDSLAEESLTVQNPGIGPAPEVFLPAGQPQPLDEMLASLEGSGATVTEVRVITKTVKVEPEEEKDVKTHQAHLINIADELDALASDLTPGKEATPTSS
ncbi:band 4.1-like protein 1 [Oscarella lobularis]|uniref:band 4.1-like protein 1 n=1 Tax=Oscarella lobularis TaxID=121494 RepID=UPI0033138761